jgi:tetratricopeptide (TPR) repeat protein
MSQIKLSDILKTAFIIIILTFSLQSFGQDNDAIKITEAKLAIEKYKDYPAALKALKEVSSEGQKDPLYIYYSAVANEQTGNLQLAIDFYKKYLSIFPNKTEIIEKIADLNYKLKKITDLSGLWYEGGTTYKLTQTGNNITISFEQGFDYSYRKQGDSKFSGYKTGNSITGTFTMVWTKANYDFKDPNECVGKVVSLDCTGSVSSDGTRITLIYPDFYVEPWQYSAGCKTTIDNTKKFEYVITRK